LPISADLPTPGEPNPDFHDALLAFVGSEVRFLVVGAHAVGAHGVPRATQDLDIWIDPAEANARRAWHALVEFGAPLKDLKIEPGDFARAETVVQVGRPPNRIDILTDLSGLTFDEAWSTRIEGLVEGVRVPILGRDALIRNKRAAGRHKDLGDVEALGERLGD
jgi:hypothetical protein